uniref:TBC1 domain family member 15 n=1 Tax=Strigamia maritima TaxID=126957 RepID=T1J7U5_STRMM
MAASEGKQGKVVYEQEGVFIEFADAEEDTLINGKLTITEKPFGVFVEWQQIDEPEYLFEQSSEWDVVNRAAVTNGADSSSKSHKHRVRPITFELSDLRSFQCSRDSKGWPDVTFFQKDGTTHPTMNFHLGKIDELLSTFDKYIKMKQPKAQKNLWLVVDPNVEALEKSLTELHLSRAHRKRLDLDAYNAAMSGFSKVTKFLYDYMVSDNSQSRPISDVEEILHDSLPLEINQADAGFELITQKDLIPRPNVIRGDPLTQEEWRMHVDEVGRVKDADELRKKVFRGGISHSIRYEVWKFLLKVYSFDSTFEQRKEQKKENVDDYYRMKLQWKSISKVQELRFSDLRDRKSLIDKDVSRTDRAHPYFEGDNNDNLGILHDILMTYCMYNFDLGYVQGMSDILAPILVVMENEVDAFWSFVGFMERICHNFEMDQQGMKTQLRQLFTLLHFIDSELCDYLEAHDSGNLYFCFRWLLIIFKREFKFPEIMKLWEVLWTDLPCKNFHLLFCYAVLDSEKEIIMENKFGFTEILKHINDLSQHIRLEENLAKAEAVYLQLAECPYLPQSVQDILGIILPEPDITDSLETLVDKPELPRPVNNKSPQSNTSSVDNSSIELLYDVDAETHYQMTVDYNLYLKMLLNIVMGSETRAAIAKCISCSEVTSTNIWKSCLAEFIGTLVLVLVGCGSCVSWNAAVPADLVQISLAFGVTVATIVQCICHVSGGHINPAVSIGMLVTLNISVLRCVLYVLCQCVGAIVGSVFLKVFTPNFFHKSMGPTVVNASTSSFEAVGVEFFITFVLVLTVFAVCDPNRNDVKGSAPLAIGLAVATCHLFAIPYTGSSMNPARSLGPAIILNIWNNHWVYWIGPILGGVTAAIFYKFVLSDRKRDLSSTESQCLIGRYLGSDLDKTRKSKEGRFKRFLELNAMLQVVCSRKARQGRKCTDHLKHTSETALGLCKIRIWDEQNTALHRFNFITSIDSIMRCFCEFKQVATTKPDFDRDDLWSYERGRKVQLILWVPAKVDSGILFLV